MVNREHMTQTLHSLDKLEYITFQEVFGAIPPLPPIDDDDDGDHLPERPDQPSSVWRYAVAGLLVGTVAAIITILIAGM
jgi:hypothetical protein